MRVLVTGGAGFIGSHIANRLLGDGHEVVVLDNFSTGRRENIAAIEARGLGDLREPVRRESRRLTVVEGDVRDEKTVRACTEGCALVYHEAAVVSVPYTVEHPQESHDVNIQGTLNVLQAARAAKVRRVVFASSAAIYGEEPTLPKVETMRPEPISPYGVEKITGEHYLATWAKLFELETVSLRYFNVFGPRQDPSSPYSGVISIFVDRILAGRGITFFGDGKQVRDFVYVSNVVDANILAGTKPGVSGRAFNVACGKQTTLLELATLIEKAAGKTVERSFGPGRAGDIKESVANIERAQSELSYAPAVDVDEGIRHLVEHVRMSPTRS